MGPTIHDVARVANTSKSTVSRYLNGQKVKKETQEALEKAILELNYHRNENARRLVMSRTNTIGIVVDNISNIFYSGIIRGIEEVANRKGYNCIFYSGTSNAKREASFLHLLFEGQVDGIILLSFQKRDRKDLEQMLDMPYPLALIGDHGEMDGLFSVDIDNASGVSDLVTYLHGLGHRKVAYISGPPHMGPIKYRFKGLEQTMKELQMECKPEWIVTSDWSNQGGYEAMKELLKQDGYTAVIASNDETAIGALRAMQEAGIQVPEQMSIVGFDDITQASWVYPPLTTVKQPLKQVGLTAAEGLFAQIEGLDEVKRTSQLYKPTLIVRQSCTKL
ncbi:LacI family DNA-binding transcriptional regulator [Paenibacillus sp. GCM10023248]|uniref:LacI family DNA-binding transcriptional regulator n=1 Tax=Bacillales TaxID=1385 RepID=UPI002379564F|nr:MULTISPECIES: LacI family DNA-binding transcriptional regulator [Bacillales]MDD9267368.1 LacI family DNA-binding transcriptional regulator [Paenibacillus sp. MAHUQ-63]MDR6882583.1 DNA-binding LacI/PurR family transcriptional regulator [Bacillus sp. 3255]